ncbi:MAG TPA: transcriptional regulator [Streptosporangiaceae bacterium]|jgi:predicted DNA-binding transcriptional regulator YafY
MRASRLVSLLLLLQTRGRMTAQQLADALEVSVRTIYRDVESLSAAGIPLYGDAGPAGGYQLLGGYRTRLTGFTAAEAEALVLAGAPHAAAELGLGTVLAAAKLKLSAALPAGLRERAAVVEERFLLDSPGWYSDGDASVHLATVAEAVWSQRRIEVCYRRWAAPTDVTRTLDPHGIVLKGGRWYLVARAGTGMRTYRINQIISLSPLDEHFERHEDFDLPSYWQTGISEFRAGLQQGEATVRLSPDGRERLREQSSAAVSEAVAATASEPGEDGWITAVLPIESLRHARSEFLRLGAEIEVLEPAALRAEMASTARGLVTLYAGAS